MTEHAIAHGDVLATLKQLPSNSFDALLCDPPYGFSFMGKKWDYDVPSVAVWAEALRVLKPGAPLLSFGGARTFHRIAIGIEDAGFELRDCLMWLYGKGFPKSQNIGLAIDGAAGAKRTKRELTARATGDGLSAISANKDCAACGRPVYGGDLSKACTCPKDSGPITPLAQAWDGYGTALKPAYEPILLARKPLIGTMAENVAAWGCGGLAIDACRIGTTEAERDWMRATARPNQATSGWGLNGNGERMSCPAGFDPHDAGRWPANLALDEHAGAALDASVAPTKSVPYPEHAADGAVLPLNKRAAGGYADAGGPSRFFYCAKVSTKERERGCEALPMRSAGEVTEREDGSDGLASPRAGAGRTGGARNHHPTLKPISLTTWLASLIKPPTSGAKLLVPFSGAGSEMIGALQAGWPLVLGIEGEAEYVAIAHARIAAWGKP